MDVALATVAAYNRHDLAGFAQLHDPEARIEFPGRGEIGLGEWITVLDGLFAALPDLRIRPVTMVADESTVVIEMHQVGTHTGATPLDDATRELLGVEGGELRPTGRAVEVAGVVALEVADGAVVEERHHWPPHWFYEQLGLVTVEPIPTQERST